MLCPRDPDPAGHARPSGMAGRILGCILAGVVPVGATTCCCEDFNHAARLARQGLSCLHRWRLPDTRRHRLAGNGRRRRAGLSRRTTRRTGAGSAATPTVPPPAATTPASGSIPAAANGTQGTGTAQHWSYCGLYGRGVLGSSTRRGLFRRQCSSPTPGQALTFPLASAPRRAAALAAARPTSSAYLKKYHRHL